MRKKLLSIILAISMLACMIPLGTMTAFAEPEATKTVEITPSGDYPEPEVNVDLTVGDTLKVVVHFAYSGTFTVEEGGAKKCLDGIPETITFPSGGGTQSFIVTAVKANPYTSTPARIDLSCDLAHFYGKVRVSIKDVPAHTHILTEVKTCAATCTTDGVKTAYWVCTGEGGCGKCFTAQTGGTEISADTLAKDYIISATGHDFSGNAVSNNNGTHSFKCVNGTCTAVGTMDGNTAAVENGTENCYGGTANCMSGAICEKCEAEYTDKNAENHVTEDRTPVAAQTATCQHIGWDAYEECACGEKLGYNEYSQLDHSYTGAVKANNDGTHSFMCVNGCNEYGGTVECVDELGDGFCDICGATMDPLAQDENSELEPCTNYVTGFCKVYNEFNDIPVLNVIFNIIHMLIHAIKAAF